MRDGERFRNLTLPFLLLNLPHRRDGERRGPCRARENTSYATETLRLNATRSANGYRYSNDSRQCNPTLPFLFLNFSHRRDGERHRPCRAREDMSYATETLRLNPNSQSKRISLYQRLVTK